MASRWGRGSAAVRIRKPLQISPGAETTRRGEPPVKTAVCKSKFKDWEETVPGEWKDTAIIKEKLE